MSLAFVLTPDADSEIQDAHAWYEYMQVGRGDEFVVELFERIDDVCKSPKLFSLVDRKTRAAMLPYSKFIVYFRIEDAGIVIIAVQHARAHPNKWRRRK